MSTEENKITNINTSLLEKVQKWFYDRGLVDANPRDQMLKLFEEAGELAGALAKNNDDEIVDAIGDIQVVLIGLSLQLNIDYNDALQIAYDEIKDRKGKLVDGVFIKEEDL